MKLNKTNFLWLIWLNEKFTFVWIDYKHYTLLSSSAQTILCFSSSINWSCTFINIPIRIKWNGRTRLVGGNFPSDNYLVIFRLMFMAVIPQIWRFLLIGINALWGRALSLFYEHSCLSFQSARSQAEIHQLLMIFTILDGNCNFLLRRWLGGYWREVSPNDRHVFWYICTYQVVGNLWSCKEWILWALKIHS